MYLAYYTQNFVIKYVDLLISTFYNYLAKEGDIMKCKSSFSLAMTYAGSFLGAGYVSGRELWQYFGRYGAFGLVGLLLTMLLFAFLGYALFTVVSKTCCSQMDKVIVQKDNKFLLILVSVLQILNFLSIYIIMIAGIGAMFKTVFGFSEYIVLLITSVIMIVFAVGGIGRLIKVFSFTVPILIVVAVIISILSMVGKEDLCSFSFENQNGYFWLFSCLVYMSFNFFGIVGIMSPVFIKVKNNKTAITGIILGTTALFIIAVFLIVALNVNTSYINEQLPMLNLSFSMGNIPGIIYSVLLFLAMLGTALSSLVATENFLVEKKEFYKRHRLSCLILIATVCFLCSLVGFGKLIEILYPLFGVTGFFAIVLIVYNYFAIKMKKQT